MERAVSEFLQDEFLNEFRKGILESAEKQGNIAALHAHVEILSRQLDVGQVQVVLSDGNLILTVNLLPDAQGIGRHVGAEVVELHDDGAIVFQQLFICVYLIV